MSEFHVAATAGNLPPEVAELFGTNFDSAGNPPGTATPSNHKLYILGTNGLVTFTETTDAPNDTVQIGFATAATVTSDGAGQTQTILTFATTNNSSFALQAMFTAYEAATGNAFGGRMLVLCKNVAGVVTIVSELENFGGGDAALLTCSFTAAGAGTLLDLNVTGVAGRTIDWSVITPGIVGAS